MIEAKDARKVEVEGWSMTLTQEPDACDSETADVQRIIATQEDGGGGAYWYISTGRWAFDSIDEFVDVLRKAGVPEGKP